MINDRQIYNIIYEIIENDEKYLYESKMKIKDLKLCSSKLIYRPDSQTYNEIQKTINDNIETYSIRILQYKQQIQRHNQTLKKIKKKFNEIKTIVDSDYKINWDD